MARRPTLLRMAVLVMVVLWPLAASAAPPDDADRASIRSMISGQIDAFRADDGATAFSFASPTVQGIFHDPARFMEMVRRGYLPVYRPRSVAFGSSVEAGGQVLQQVFLVGPDGNHWVAIYAMQKQEDGSWRINGVQLARDRTGSSV